ncbi:hypothetical protein ACP70R_008937 [Stipagrostis hirtigluma subsp. patula]
MAWRTGSVGGAASSSGAARVELEIRRRVELEIRWLVAWQSGSELGARWLSKARTAAAADEQGTQRRYGLQPDRQRAEAEEEMCGQRGKSTTLALLLTASREVLGTFHVGDIGLSQGWPAGNTNDSRATRAILGSQNALP